MSAALARRAAASARDMSEGEIAAVIRVSDTKHTFVLQVSAVREPGFAAAAHYPIPLRRYIR
jgi:hypothetical protein